MKKEEEIKKNEIELKAHSPETFPNDVRKVYEGKNEKKKSFIQFLYINVHIFNNIYSIY